MWQLLLFFQFALVINQITWAIDINKLSWHHNFNAMLMVDIFGLIKQIILFLNFT